MAPQEADLLFHLGMPKTGTSALQNALSIIQGQRHEQVFYPALYRGSSPAHHALAAALSSGHSTEIADTAKVILDHLEQTRQTVKGPRPLIYSSEGLTSLCTYRRVSHFLTFIGSLQAKAAVRAVLVVREISSFLESMYLQSGRTGTVRSEFDHYVLSRQHWMFSPAIK